MLLDLTLEEIEHYKYNSTIPNKYKTFDFILFETGNFSF